MIHALLADAWRARGYDRRSTDAAKRASELAASLPMRERSLVEARYHVAVHERDRAIEIYRAAFKQSPDDLELGLLLADTQVAGQHPKDAEDTIATLRALPPP